MKLGPIPHQTPAEWVSILGRVEVERDGEWLEGQIVSDRRFMEPIASEYVEVDGVTHEIRREIVHESATVQLADGSLVDIYSAASEKDHASHGVDHSGPRWRH